MGDEDYVDDTKVDAGALDPARLEAIKKREGNVQSLMGRRSYGDALRAALENPPLASKSAEVKSKNSEVIMSVLTNIKEAEMAGVVATLSDDNLDVLMKYIYKGLGEAKDSSSLLKWHAAVVEKAGLGCIIRSMTELAA